MPVDSWFAMPGRPRRSAYLDLKQQKDLWANVEYYKGVVFYALGVPTRFFTTLFAMSRTVGYLAHFLETRQDNRLIRPQALYTGKDISRVPTA